MEQSHDLSRGWIDAGEIGTLVQIAVDASEREILLIIAPPVLAGNDVLDMQSGKRRIVLMKETILTAIPRTPSDECPHGGSHAAPADLNLRASRRSTATNLLARM